MKAVVSTKNAPGAIGPYSQGIKSGQMIFTSGQLPMTADGVLELDDIKAAARISLDNVKAVLKAAGADMGDIVKTTVFLTDLSDFEAVNEVYGGYFTLKPPARSCVQVAALPRGAKIEIEAVAVLG